MTRQDIGHMGNPMDINLLNGDITKRTPKELLAYIQSSSERLLAVAHSD